MVADSLLFLEDTILQQATEFLIFIIFIISPPFSCRGSGNATVISFLHFNQLLTSIVVFISLKN